MRRIIAIIAGVWALHSVVAAQTQHGGHGAHATVRRQSMVATPELESAVETYHHGMVAMQRGRLSEAEASFKEALQAQPQLHEASISLANLLMRPGSERWGEALRLCRQVVRVLEETETAEQEPVLAGIALSCVASAVQMSKAVEGTPEASEAENALRRAASLAIADDDASGAATAYHNLGVFLSSLGRSHDAQAAFSEAENCVGDGDGHHPGMLIEQGNLAMLNGDGAAAHRYFTRATVRARQMLNERQGEIGQLGTTADNRYGGRAFRDSDCGLAQSAEARLLMGALQNLAEVERESGLAASSTALLAELSTMATAWHSCDERNSAVQTLLQHTGFLQINVARSAFDWRLWSSAKASRADAVTRGISEIVDEGWKRAPSPGVFHCLYMPLSAMTIHGLARVSAWEANGVLPGLYMDSLAPYAPLRGFRRHRRAQIFRVGFLSYDFRGHVSSYMIESMLRTYNRSLFSIHCYHIGPTVTDADVARAEAIASACDTFSSLGRLSDANVVETIENDRLEALVDLSGHMTGARLGITGRRPAAVLVNYLGYPGTTGAPWYDYIVVDRFIAGAELTGELSEARVFLPHSYQVNSYKADQPFRGDTTACPASLRTSLGLPTLESGRIVLAALNSPKKVDVQMFHLWCAVLKRHPGAVLWILAPQEDPSASHGSGGQQRLKEEAAACGVAKHRVLFAPRVSRDAHISRLACADLFLDTCIYNGHTTVADALWGRIPVVACTTPTFHGRVASSLLSASLVASLGVSYSLRDYEDLALTLGNSIINDHVSTFLASTQLRAPLFDYTRTTRNLQRAQHCMWEAASAAAWSGFGCQHRDGPRRGARCNSLRISQLPHIAVNPGARRMPQLAPMLAELHTEDSAVRGSDSPAQLLQDWDEHLSAAVNDGAVALAGSDIEGSVRACQRVAESYSTHGGAAELRARAFALRGDYYEAIQQLTNAAAWYNSGIGGVVSEVRSDLATSAVELRSQLVPSALEQLRADIAAASMPGSSPRKRTSTLWESLGLVARLAQLEDEAVNALQNFAWSRAAEARADLLAANASVVALQRQRVQRARLQGVARLALYCDDYGKGWFGQWGPWSMLHGGVGGSEEAIIFLSKELASLGAWRVEVYAEPPQRYYGAEIDGVAWYPLGAYDPHEPADVFVAQRYDISLYVGRHSRARLLWLHDLVSSALLEHGSLVDADRIFVGSRYHASVSVPTLLLPIARVVPNGLSQEQFADLDSIERLAHTFVYASAPQRGLEQVLEAWPSIKSRVPGARLLVFYGFSKGFETWARNQMSNYNAWRSRMDQLLLQPGVEYRGMVPPGELVAAFASASLTLYPTSVEIETGCISVLKAMANGAIPVTSRYRLSVLPELTSRWDLGPPARPTGKISQDAAWLQEWADAVVDAVHMPQSEIEQLRSEMVAWARRERTWSAVASLVDAEARKVLLEGQR